MTIDPRGTPLLTLGQCILATAIVLLALGSARGAVIISEVDPNGSSAIYGADWYELTNTGTAAVDITGWAMDDDSDDFSKAVPLTGATSIAAGQSVVFVEDTGTTDATIDAAFESAWFGMNVPAGFTIGNYGGSKVGLGSSGDEVNIFDADGNAVTGVSFGPSAVGVTFDNAAGVGGTGDPRPTISTTSSIGVDGAFESADGEEVGSPGRIASPAPEPSSMLLVLLGAGLLAAISTPRGRRESRSGLHV